MIENDLVGPFQDRFVFRTGEAHVLDPNNVKVGAPPEKGSGDGVVEVLVGGEADHAGRAFRRASNRSRMPF